MVSPFECSRRIDDVGHRRGDPAGPVAVSGIGFFSRQARQVRNPFLFFAAYAFLARDIPKRSLREAYPTNFFVPFAFFAAKSYLPPCSA
jgi:hypothetical protein